LSYLTTLLALVILYIGSCFLPSLAWTEILLYSMLPIVAEMTGMHHHAQLFSIEMRSHEIFFCQD
jgi:hypothetical protein